MNQPQPNPLLRELARGKQAEPHPDEDVLTALAEHGLPERERGQVMEHLSHCAECREVLSFAVAAMPEEVRQGKVHMLPVRPPLRGWLPWVAIAAGVVVVSSAVVIHERAAKVHVEQENAAVTVAKATPPSPILPPPALRQKAEPLPAPAVELDQRRQTVAPQAQTYALKKVAPAVVAPSTGIEQETYSNLPLGVAGQTGGQMTTAGSAAAANTNVLDATNSAAPAQIAAQDEAIHGTMSAQAKSVRAPSASATAAPAFGGLIGGAGVLARSAARTQWRINAQGQAERSVGYGPWQTVLTEEKTRMRVVSVSGNDIWLGGDSLRLYHSEDNGATWHVMQLPAKGSGDHVIAHIHFESGQTGTVEAEDGAQWNTVDGGTTWK